MSVVVTPFCVHTYCHCFGLNQKYLAQKLTTIFVRFDFILPIVTFKVTAGQSSW